MPFLELVKETSSTLLARSSQSNVGSSSEPRENSSSTSSQRSGSATQNSGNDITDSDNDNDDDSCDDDKSHFSGDQAESSADKLARLMASNRTEKARAKALVNKAVRKEKKKHDLENPPVKVHEADQYRGELCQQAKTCNLDLTHMN